MILGRLLRRYFGEVHVKPGNQFLLLFPQRWRQIFERQKVCLGRDYLTFEPFDILGFFHRSRSGSRTFFYRERILRIVGYCDEPDIVCISGHFVQSYLILPLRIELVERNLVIPELKSEVFQSMQFLGVEVAPVTEIFLFLLGDRELGRIFLQPSQSLRIEDRGVGIGREYPVSGNDFIEIAIL